MNPTNPRTSPPIAILPAAPSVGDAAGSEVAEDSSAPPSVVVVASDVLDGSLVEVKDPVETVVEDVIGGRLVDSVFVPTMVDNGTLVVMVLDGAGVVVAPIVLTTYNEDEYQLFGRITWTRL